MKKVRTFTRFFIPAWILQNTLIVTDMKSYTILFGIAAGKLVLVVNIFGAKNWKIASNLLLSYNSSECYYLDVLYRDSCYLWKFACFGSLFLQKMIMHQV